MFGFPFRLLWAVVFSCRDLGLASIGFRAWPGIRRRENVVVAREFAPFVTVRDLLDHVSASPPTPSLSVARTSCRRLTAKPWGDHDGRLLGLVYHCFVEVGFSQN